MRWFTSDLHLGHTNIINYSNRPFYDVDEMHSALITAWNDRVDPSDEVWILGDLAMGRLTSTVPLVEHLNGEITLLCGNHDMPWFVRSPKTHQKWDHLYEATGIRVLGGHTEQLDVGGCTVDVSHFPYSGDSHDIDRFPEYRPVDEGRWLLHGHVHERWRQQGKQINVGVDAWGGAPVSETTVAELILAGANDLAPTPWQ